MADLVLVSVIIGFTALCTAYISWCDRIIGSDAVVADEQDAMIATAAYDNWVGLGLAVLAIAYLVGVLIFPERF